MAKLVRVKTIVQHYDKLDRSTRAVDHKYILPLDVAGRRARQGLVEYTGDPVTDEERDGFFDAYPTLAPAPEDGEVAVETVSEPKTATDTAETADGSDTSTQADDSEELDVEIEDDAEIAGKVPSLSVIGASSKPSLEKFAGGITVGGRPLMDTITGTGTEGAVLKADLVKALRALHDA